LRWGRGYRVPSGGVCGGRREAHLEGRRMGRRAGRLGRVGGPRCRTEKKGWCRLSVLHRVSRGLCGGIRRRDGQVPVSLLHVLLVQFLGAVGPEVGCETGRTGHNCPLPHTSVPRTTSSRGGGWNRSLDAEGRARMSIELARGFLLWCTVV